MNRPVMEGVRLNTPAYVRHNRLIEWVAEIAALTEAKDVYWCDGSTEEYDRLSAQLVEAGTFRKLNPALRLQQPERRGARGRSHLHLQREEGRRRPHQQLDGSGRDARLAADRPG